MTQLRIFSYLPNPRVAKATIAARLCSVQLDVRGAPAAQLVNWLWDFEARPISDEEKPDLAHLVVKSKTGFTTPLYKTPAFLDAHPFGTVPAAFGPDGSIGIFESNSILRTVARVATQPHTLYGNDPYVASRIDSFLDLGHDFGRDVQEYILGMRGGALSVELYERAERGATSYFAGIERALARRRYVVGDEMTLADICFVCETALLHNEKNFHSALAAKQLEPLLTLLGPSHYPRANELFDELRRHPAFAPDLESYLVELPLR
jgi:glutathione S-transferase